MHGNSREELFYFAGLFDGEGSIMVVRNESPTFMKNRIHPHYGIVGRMGMVDRDSIYAFHACFGLGRVYEEKPYHHKRPIIRWMCSRVDEIKQFIVKIRPFLRLKQRNADLALEYIEKCSGALGRRITPEMNKLQHEYYIRMRAFNGIDSPATTERTGRRGRSKGLRT